MGSGTNGVDATGGGAAIGAALQLASISMHCRKTPGPRRGPAAAVVEAGAYVRGAGGTPSKELNRMLESESAQIVPAVPYNYL